MLPLHNKQKEMAYKNTIAIIGASYTLGTIIAIGISNVDNRLLLMDEGRLQQLVKLRNEIFALKSATEIELLHCCKGASWEADIIIVAVDSTKQIDIAAKIKEVSTCKVVIFFTSSANNGNEMQKLLPHSKVINVSISGSIKNVASMHAIVNGKDLQALQITIEMIKKIGFNYQNKI